MLRFHNEQRPAKSVNKIQAFLEKITGLDFPKLKEEFIKRRIQLYAIFTTLGVLIVLLCVICLAPLTFKHKMIIEQAKNLGIDMKINGTVNFNIFNLSLVITDSDLVLRHDTKTKCTVSAEINVPRMNINLVTGAIYVKNANVDVIAVGQNNLRAFIEKITQNNALELLAENATINITQCIHDIGRSTGQNAVEDLHDANVQLYAPIEQQLKVDYLRLWIEDNQQRLRIKFHDSYNNYCKLKYDNVKFLGQVALTIDSNLLQFSLNFNKSKVNENFSNIGQYSINVPNLAAIYRTVSNKDFRFIANILSNVELKSSGTVLYHQNVIKVANSFESGYGNGNFIVSWPNNNVPSISISFTNLKYSKQKAKENAVDSEDSELRIIDMIFAPLLHKDHSLQMDIKSLTFDTGRLEGVTLDYVMLNQKFFPNKIELKLEDGNIKYVRDKPININIASNARTKKPGQEPTTDIATQNQQGDGDATTVKLDIQGSNVAKLAVIAEAIIGKPEIFAVIKEDEKLPYQGTAELSLDPNGDFGIKNFDLTIEGASIAGSYLYHVSNNKSPVAHGLKLMTLRFSNVNFNRLLTRKAMYQILQYDKMIAASDTQDDNTPLASINALFLTNSEPAHLQFSIDHSTIENRSIPNMKMLVHRHHNYLEIRDLSIDTDFINGTGYFSMKTNSSNPEISTSIAIEKLDLNIIEQILQGIMTEQGKSNITIKEWLKDCYQYLQKRYRWQISILEDLLGKLNITANNISYNNNSGGQLSIVSNIADRIIRIDRASIGLFGGTMNFNGTVYIHAMPKMALNFSATNLDLLPAMHSMLDVDNVITGRLNINNSAIESYGNNLREFIHNMSGQIDINIDKFTIQKINATGLYKALSNNKNGKATIDPLKILTDGGGTEFPSAQGRIILRNGRIETSGVTAKTVGVSHIVSFSLDILDQSIASMEGRILVLAPDPRPGLQYLNIPLAFKVMGPVRNPQVGIFAERVTEYLQASTRMRNATDIAP